MSVHAQEIRDARPHAAELKFVVDRALGDAIAEWARARLDPDPYGTGPFGDEYDVTSLYFDTLNLDVLQRRGSFGRSKYRVRRYGAASTVFLERKLRRPGLLHKRRSLARIDEIGRLADVDRADGWTGRWFHRRLAARQLGPACQLAYTRLARVARNDDGLIRLTLDRHVHVQGIDRVAFADGPSLELLADQTVLELKYRRTLPPIFKELVERFALVPTGSSKYRLGMIALGHHAGTAAAPAADATTLGGLA